MMKISNLLGLAGLALCLSACSAMYGPTYFGSNYPVTDSVQTFYSAKDVKLPYKVIGHMVAPISNSESYQETVKRQLIEKAKKVGANGLIFSDIVRETHKTTIDDFSIKAEVIVFTEK